PEPDRTRRLRYPFTQGTQRPGDAGAPGTGGARAAGRDAVGQPGLRPEDAGLARSRTGAPPYGNGRSAGSRAAGYHHSGISMMASQTKSTPSAAVGSASTSSHVASHS